MSRGPVPILPVTIGLGGALPTALAPVLEEVSQAVAAEFATLLAWFGVPGTPVIGWGTGSAPDGEPAPDEVVSLTVAGHRTAHPGQALAVAHGYLTGVPAGGGPLSGVADWLVAAGRGRDEPGGPPRQDAPAGPGGFAGRLLALVCRSAVIARPDLLLPPEQSNAYLDQLALPEAVDRAAAGAVLRATVDLGYRLIDLDAVRAALIGATESGGGPLAAIDELTSAGLPSIELHLAPEYLRQVTLDHAPIGTEIAEYWRDQLFASIGLPLPKVRLVPAESLSQRSFAIRINQLPYLPRAGLGAGELFVDLAADRIAGLGIPVRPAIHPVTGAPAGITDLDRWSRIEAASVTAGQQLWYIELALRAELAERWQLLLNRTVVDWLLTELRPGFPELEAAVRERYRLAEVVAVLRDLLTTRGSIRNLRGILHLLLEYADRPAGSTGMAAAEFVRAGLATLAEPAETVGECCPCSSTDTPTCDDGAA